MSQRTSYIKYYTSRTRENKCKKKKNAGGQMTVFLSMLRKLDACGIVTQILTCYIHAYSFSAFSYLN